MARPVGFAMKERDVLAFPAREPDVGENVSHVWVLDADQLRVVPALPALLTITV
jgi:hypothetical protein